MVAVYVQGHWFRHATRGAQRMLPHADFKQRYVWWESIVMLRKLAVAAIVTFAGAHTSAGVQLLVVMCVLALAVAAHAACMPYHHLYTNILEQVSICVLLVNIYLSLFLNADISVGGRVAVSVLVLAINISMVLVFIFYIVEAYWYGALFEAGLDGVPQVDRSKVTLEEVRWGPDEVGQWHGWWLVLSVLMQLEQFGQLEMPNCSSEPSAESLT